MSDVEELSLFRSEARGGAAGEELDVARDDGEGGAQLVGRHAQKGALEPACFLRRVFRRPEILFRPLAIGDVDHEPLPVLRSAILVSDQRHLVMDPHLAVVPRQEPILERERLAGFVGPGDLGQDPFAVVRVDPLDPEVGSGEPLVRRVAKERLNPGTDIER